MTERSYSSGDYRYGFNGKENDNEVKDVQGSQQDYGMRIYDPRIGKFLSVDPITDKYPWYSPFQFAGNKPILFVDIDGLEEGLEMRTRRREDAYLNNEISEDEYSAQTKASGLGGAIGGAIVGLFYIGPAAGTPLLLSLITGVPVNPAPQAFSTLARTAVNSAAAVEAEETVPLFRGVNEANIAFDDAVQGNAIPRGGNATALEHNTVTTDSKFTSWTTDRQVAENFAKRPDGKGVVLEKEIPKSQTVVSPNTKNVLLKGTTKVVTESEVLVKGQVTGAKVCQVGDW